MKFRHNRFIWLPFVLILVALYGVSNYLPLKKIIELNRLGVLEQAFEQKIWPAKIFIGEFLNLFLNEVCCEHDENDLQFSSDDFLALGLSELTPHIAESALEEMWQHSFGGPDYKKFSNLKQVNVSNIGSLEKAWIVNGNGPEIANQSTPIYNGKHLVARDTNGEIRFLDPDTGNIEGVFDAGISDLGYRGLNYVHHAELGSAVLASGAGRIFAIDPTTFRTAEGYFRGKSVKVGYRTKTIPLLVGSKVVVTTTQPSLNVYHAETGRLHCKQDYINTLRPNHGHKWLPKTFYRGGNNWGGFAVDLERNIAYLTTSNPTPVALNADRPGNNPGTVSVIAIDLTDCNLLWYFQEIPSDIWDLDIASPPLLTKIELENRFYDVVVAVTKAGNTLILDRVSGRPVFGFERELHVTTNYAGDTVERLLPAAGQPTSFGDVSFYESDLRESIKPGEPSNLQFGRFTEHKVDSSTVFRGLHGGAMHLGASANDKNGILFVTSSNEPSLITISNHEVLELKPNALPTYSKYCTGCHADNPSKYGRSGPEIISSIELYEELAVKQMVINGVRSMPPISLSNLEWEKLYAELTRVASLTPTKTRERNVKKLPYKKLTTIDGLPNSSLVWGMIHAVDLNNASIKWSKPFGSDDVKSKGVVNLGGILATEGGLVFASGGTDSFLHAYEAASGDKLRSWKLPATASSSPMTFIHNCKQYVVLNANGGGTLGLYNKNVSSANLLIAYSLVQNVGSVAPHSCPK